MVRRLSGVLGLLLVVLALAGKPSTGTAQSADAAAPGTSAAAAGETTTGVADSAAPSGETMFRPVAVVNDSAITGFDLLQRVQILTALGYPVASAEALKQEALNQLIDDQLKLQEARRYGVTATPEMIAQDIERLAKSRNMSADELVATLAQRGVSRQALEDMLAADLAWRQLVRKRFLGRIEPGDAEIDGEIALMQERAGVSYRLAEIGIPVAQDGSDREKVRAKAERIYRDLAAGGDFEAAVKKYSRSPSAARGGEIGWVSNAQLPPEVADVLSELKPGQVAPPIPVPGGFTIIKVLDRRALSNAGIDPSDPKLREQVRRQLIARQTARLAEGLLQELRRDAVIETR